MTDETLASWKDGPAKRAIVGFVTSATQEGSGFVPVADRIATFDNDGTLWVEQPMPPQFDFVFRKWAEEVKADPSLAGQQPYKAIIEKDATFFQGVATQDPEVVATLLEAFARSWAGTTPDEFDAQVREWLTDGQPAEVRRALRQARLQADAGAARLSEGQRLPGVRVLGRWPRLHARVRRGDLGHLQGERDRQRRRVHVRRRQDRPLRASYSAAWTSGPGKPEHIFAQTGRLPAFAGGNADVDIEMLEAAKFAAARQPRRRGARVRLHHGGGEVAGEGRRAGLDGGEHEERLEHRLRCGAAR